MTLPISTAAPRCWALMLVPMIAAPALAASGSSGQDGRDTQILTYVETPTRAPQVPEDTLAATTVIDRADIERLQPQSLTELLARAPGVSVSSNGGTANLSSVFIRGTEPDHVLVLVDGVRVGSATAGITAFQDIPVEQLDRIEIVRGPRSALYGADALGGVIQIFTRRGRGPARPHFSLGAGRYDSLRSQAGIAGSSHRTHYSVNLARLQSQGYDICKGDAVSAGCFTNEPDVDGYDRDSVSARVGHTFNDRVQAQATALYTDGRTEFDGSFTNASDTVQQVYGAKLTTRLNDRLALEWSAGHSRDESDDSLDGQFVSHFESQQHHAGLLGRLRLAPHRQFISGFDYRQEQVESTTLYTENRRDNRGLFVEYLDRIGQHRVQLAARGDDDEQFGEHATGSATWGWAFTSRYTLTASYGTAFNSPSFNDLYFPGFSNPQLEPEESASAELGLLYQARRFNWALRAFDTRVDELIALDSSFTPQNISEARLQGLEAEAGLQLLAWQLAANATWLDAENRADNANRGNQLPRRPEYRLQLDADRVFTRHSVGATLQINGSAYDDLGNNRKLDGYVLIDLRAGLTLSPDWQLQARLSNLMDEDYETAAFFNPPGRNLFLTLRYQPQRTPQ